MRKWLNVVLAIVLFGLIAGCGEGCEKTINEALNAKCKEPTVSHTVTDIGAGIYEVSLTFTGLGENKDLAIHQAFSVQFRQGGGTSLPQTPITFDPGLNPRCEFREAVESVIIQTDPGYSANFTVNGNSSTIKFRVSGLNDAKSGIAVRVLGHYWCARDSQHWFKYITFENDRGKLSAGTVGVLKYTAPKCN